MNLKTNKNKILTPREIVKRTLKFENPPRIPIHLWTLPWAEIHLGEELKELQRRFPDDIVSAPNVNDLALVKGDCYVHGEYIDEWGCVFQNLQDGIIGEVRDPILPDMSGLKEFNAPHHILPKDEKKALEIINSFCASTDLFVTSACFPRPWERYQFIRGTENSFTDPMIYPEEFEKLLGKIHGFYMEEMKLWSKSNVDALVFIDDWGSQQALLMDPEMWRMYFKPIYKEYCDLAHESGKFIFMHSDGNVQDIIPDLIEIGVDALNSQLFIMDMEQIARDAKGKITFWGEIDRQHILCSNNSRDVKEAVKKVAENLFDPSGGIIAQFEYGPGIVPENATVVFEEWGKVSYKESKNKIMLFDYSIPGIGKVTPESGLIPRNICSDGIHELGKNGVLSITSTGDGKVEFIDRDGTVLAYVKSAMGYPAYYPLPSVKIEKPLKAVLMDLDGTTVRSEDFWMWIIQLTMSDLLGNKKFQLEDSDIPYISGHSVSEHLQYCIDKYCPEKSIISARQFYSENTKREMAEIVEGRGRKDAFTPVEGIKDFLLDLKNSGVKIGLVTSGLYEKAYPEILSAFKTLKMGDPKDFYDSIITAGFQPIKGTVGTLGELEPKPHPWLYAESARVGLGIDAKDRHSVVGIEDSGAGITSIRLAGFTAIGIKDGNIIESGTLGLCNHYCNSFEEILKILK